MLGTHTGMVTTSSIMGRPPEMDGITVRSSMDHNMGMGVVKVSVLDTLTCLFTALRLSIKVGALPPMKHGMPGHLFLLLPRICLSLIHI